MTVDELIEILEKIHNSGKGSYSIIVGDYFGDPIQVQMDDEFREVKIY